MAALLHAWARAEAPASQGATSAAYSSYASEDQRSEAGCIGAR